MGNRRAARRIARRVMRGLKSNAADLRRFVSSFRPGRPEQSLDIEGSSAKWGRREVRRLGFVSVGQSGTYKNEEGVRVQIEDIWRKGHRLGIKVTVWGGG